MIDISSHPIGVFDSGSGGLSILTTLQVVLPKESFLYIGDHAHNPYGDKTTEYIRERTAAAISYLVEHQVKLIVIACNTSTIAGIEWYRTQFPNVPIVGVVPVIKTAALESRTRKIIVLSTEYTAKSKYQKKLITEFGSDCEVTSLGSSILVPLIEQGIMNGPIIESELTRILSPYVGGEADVLVLGCTHYPFLKPVLRAIMGGGVQILDSGGAVARQVQHILHERGELSNEKLLEDAYLTTGDAVHVSALFSTLLQHEISVSHILV